MPSRYAKRSVSVALEAPADTRTWVRRLLVALSALLLLSMFSGEIRDTDIWLHLKTGQHTIETRALTVPDPFSYTSDLDRMIPVLPGRSTIWPGCLMPRGDYAAAAPLYRRALAIAEKAFGPDDAATREIRESLDALLKKSAGGKKSPKAF